MQNAVREPLTVVAPPVCTRPLATVPQFSQKHPAFTIGSLRWLLFHRETNGLNKAVVKIGRRVLIDEDRFFDWVNEQSGRGEGALR
jgi:hypothetical protein